MKTFKIILVILLTICTSLLNAQESVLTSGGEANGTGGTVSYSLGQIVYTTNTGVNGSNAQGVQQPYEISVVTSINESNVINLVCELFPNPTKDYVKLIINSINIRNLAYQLCDANGKDIESKKIINIESIISMLGLVPSTYFLKIYENKKPVKTFKIIKN